jgi:hypothetical protein
MNQGTIVHFSKFELQGGKVKPKYFLVLNDPTFCDYLILCMTTKQQRKRDAIPGCDTDAEYFFLPEGITKFPLDTWLVFSRCYKYSTDKIQTLIDKNICQPKWSIDKELFKNVFRCALRSDDIERRVKKMLCESRPK